MENNILKKIIKYKEGNNNSLLEIIEIFNPLISKYSRLLDKEDTRQDLIIHLIKVLNKVPIDNKCLFKNKEIIGYNKLSVIGFGKTRIFDYSYITEIIDEAEQWRYPEYWCSLMYKRKN